MNHWYVRHRGKVSGPFEADRIREHMENGTIDATAQCAVDATGPWAPISRALRPQRKASVERTHRSEPAAKPPPSAPVSPRSPAHVDLDSPDTGSVDGITEDIGPELDEDLGLESLVSIPAPPPLIMRKRPPARRSYLYPALFGVGGVVIILLGYVIVSSIWGSQTPQGAKETVPSDPPSVASNRSRPSPQIERPSSSPPTRPSVIRPATPGATFPSRTTVVREPAREKDSRTQSEPVTDTNPSWDEVGSSVSRTKSAPRVAINSGRPSSSFNTSRPRVQPQPPTRPSTTAPVSRPFNSREIDAATLRSTAESLAKLELSDADKNIVDDVLSLTRRREWADNFGKSSWGDLITIWPDRVRIDTTKFGDERVSREKLSPSSELVVKRLCSVGEAMHEIQERIAETGSGVQPEQASDSDLPRPATLRPEDVDPATAGRNLAQVAIELEAFGVGDGVYGSKSLLINGVLVGILPRSSDRWTPLTFDVPRAVLSGLRRDSSFQITCDRNSSDAFKVRSVRLVATLSDGRRVVGRPSGTFTSAKGWTQEEGEFFRTPSDSGPLPLDVPQAVLGDGPATEVIANSIDTSEGPATLTNLPGQPSGDLEAASTHTAVKRGPPVQPPASTQVAGVVLKTQAAFSEELANVHDEAARKKIVGELLAIADSTEVGPVERFAAIDVALDLAMVGGSARLVRDLLDARSEWFERQDRLEPMLQFITTASLAGRADAVDSLPLLLDLSDEALSVGRFGFATKAADLAASLINKVPADRLDAWMPRVKAQVTRAKEAQGIDEAGIAARKTLETAPEDSAANLQCGISSVIVGEWAAAIRYFQKSTDPAIQAAATAEQSIGNNPAAQEYFDLAGRWWEVAATSEGSVDAQSQAKLPSISRGAIQEHARSLYQKSLQAEPGLASPIDRKLATSRSAKAEPVSATPVTPTPVATTAPEPLFAGKFDEEAFLRAEQKRASLFESLTQAIISRDQYNIPRLRSQLAGLRGAWCGAMHIYDRDTQLAQREAAIKEVLRADPDFSDGWLCDCYLRILRGDRDGAVTSLNKAEELIHSDALRQLYTGYQLLDCATAAILLGDGDRATKVRNALKKNFPNDPGLLVLESKVYMYKSLFSDAKRNYDKLLDNGAQQPAVMAELAWLLSAAPVDSIRDPKRASDAVDQAMASGQGPQWLAWRARAALFANEGKWGDALKALDQAARQAPLLLGEEIERQRKQYELKEPYWIERKK